ncbi:Transcription elongation factor spt6 [Borealophlyctis nickersoniae]|nr:Transcription elongation factor spt6 [Borealophlyctis nickersoniae]
MDEDADERPHVSRSSDVDEAKPNDGRRSDKGSDDEREKNGNVRGRSSSPAARSEEGERKIADDDDDDEDMPRKKSRKSAMLVDASDDEEVEAKRKKHKKKKKKRTSDVEDEEEEEGEDISKPSKKKLGAYSDDDSDEEDEDEEPTEADRQFVVDDEEPDEEEEEEDEGREREGRSRKKKRKRRKREISSSEDDLDDDDLDLLEEMGGKKKKFKRLRRRVEDDEDEEEAGPSNDLAKIFSDDDEVAGAKKTSAFHESELYDDEEDDIDDFIVNDDEEGEAPQMTREEKLARKKERIMKTKNLGKDFGITDRQWEDVQRLFDISEYEYALVEKPASRRADLDLEDMGEEGDVVVRKSKQLKLADVYEPAELAERMLTSTDEDLRVKDIPERLQLRGGIQGDIDELAPGELEREAMYIAKLMAAEKKTGQHGVSLIPDDRMLKAVAKIVEFFRILHFEVPFIYNHRKDYFDGILSRADLWRIYDLDMQFQRLESKRRGTRAIFREVTTHSPEAATDTYVDELLDQANSVEDISDVHGYIQLKYGDALAKVEEGRRSIKKARRRTAYDEGISAGFGRLLKLFHVDVRALAYSVSTKEPHHIPEDHYEYPLEAAKEFLKEGPPFDKPERVLEGTDPKLRDWLRAVYESDAVICTTPTTKGRLEIDYNHPYYPFKYLENKFAYKFTDGQFLSILKAEEEGLLTISIKVGNEHSLLADIVKNINNDNFSDLAAAWNEQRKMAVMYAAKEILFPLAVKSLKEKLSQRAVDFIATRCHANLEKKIDMAPFKPRRPDDDRVVYIDGPRVMALTWGDGEQNAVTVGVLLDEDGEVKDRIRLPLLRGSPEQRAHDMQRFMDILEKLGPDRRPELIAVGGFKPNTKTVLLRMLQDSLAEAYQSRKFEDDIPVMIVEDEVARLYMNSKRGIKEFPGEDNMLLRYCVSLARKAQEPTSEYARLVNADGDIKHLRLHSQQHLLPEEKLNAAIERAFVNVVNFMGVDINQAVKHPHLSSTLQFVAGLGSRKAQHMISRIESTGGKLESRADLIKKQLCAAKVFMNCASFIRIRKDPDESDDYYDVLDDTRIHPEDYDLARQMAADVMDAEATNEDENPSQNVKELFETDRADELMELMLDDYAKELETRTNEPKMITLMDTRAELIEPFRDRRRRFEGATPDQVFTMLTNESDETLYEGCIVSAQIVRVLDRLLKCTLPSGLDGVVPFNKVDIPPGRMMQDVYREKSLIQAQVVSVDKERMCVELNLKNIEARDPVVVDDYFDRRREEQDVIDRRVDMRKAKQKVVRQIQHPFWQNIDYKGATEFLVGKPNGTTVIRPSTKGNDHFSITWKVVEGVIVHLDVVESQKDNEMAVGKILTIDNQRYREIDEIIAVHIEPMNIYIQNLMQHPKYQRKELGEMQKWVAEQVAQTRRTGYGIILADKPAHFYLVFQHPQSHPKHESISVNPKGYVFRRNIFKSVDDLLTFYKRDEAKRAQGGHNRPRPPGPPMPYGQGLPPRPGGMMPPPHPVHQSGMHQPGMHMPPGGAYPPMQMPRPWG